MVPILKFASILSCGGLLCLGLSSAAQATPADDLINGQASQKSMSVWATTGHSIKGMVLGVEGHTIVVKEKDEQEARVHVDATTSMIGPAIAPGVHIEARVNEKNHALTLFAVQ
jgi:hypothetical protein